MTSSNSGFQQFGGNFTGSVATGSGSHVEYKGAGAGTAELTAVVAELRALIEEHRTALADSEAVLRDAAALADELARPQPDRDRVVDMLRGLAGRGAAVVATLEVVDKARAALEQLMR